MADEGIETGESFNTSADPAQNGDELNRSNQPDDMDNPDLEMIKARIKEMEEEAEKIKQVQNEVKKMAHNLSSGSLLSLSFEDKMEIDFRSAYVGNMSYGLIDDSTIIHNSTLKN